LQNLFRLACGKPPTYHSDSTYDVASTVLLRLCYFFQQSSSQLLSSRLGLPLPNHGKTFLARYRAVIGANSFVHRFAFG